VLMLSFFLIICLSMIFMAWMSSDHTFVKTTTKKKSKKGKYKDFARVLVHHLHDGSKGALAQRVLDHVLVHFAAPVLRIVLDGLGLPNTVRVVLSIGGGFST